MRNVSIALAALIVPALVFAQQTGENSIKSEIVNDLVEFESGSATKNGFVFAYAAVQYQFLACSGNLTLVHQFKSYGAGAPAYLHTLPPYWYKGKLYSAPAGYPKAPPMSVELRSPVVVHSGYPANLRQPKALPAVRAAVMQGHELSCASRRSAVGTFDELFGGAADEKEKAYLVASSMLWLPEKLPPLMDSDVHKWIDVNKPAPLFDPSAPNADAQLLPGIIEAELTKARTDSPDKTSRVDEEKRAVESRRSTMGAMRPFRVSTGEEQKANVEKPAAPEKVVVAQLPAPVAAKPALADQRKAEAEAQRERRQRLADQAIQGDKPVAAAPRPAAAATATASGRVPLGTSSGLGPNEILKKTRLRVPEKTEIAYVIQVPARVTRLEVFLSGGPGDLYVTRGKASRVNAQQPTQDYTADCASIRPDEETERCIFENPAPGEWYLTVFAQHELEPSRPVTLRAVVYGTGPGFITGNDVCTKSGLTALNALGEDLCTTLTAEDISVAGVYKSVEGNLSTTLSPDGTCTWQHADKTVARCQWGIVIGRDGTALVAADPRYPEAKVYRIVIKNFDRFGDAVWPFHVNPASRRMVINADRFRTY